MSLLKHFTADNLISVPPYVRPLCANVSVWLLMFSI